MSKNFKLIIFIVIVGVVTSALLLGANALTKNRIELNREAKLKSAILEGFGIEFNFSNIHDIFDQDVEIVKEGDLTFYVDQNTGRVSYQFEGSGLWGPILGMITLDADFETIIRITILQQNETPGLGGVMAERPYLDKFVGKKMVPNLEITKTNENLDYQVDAITGATSTSAAFEYILNSSYGRNRAIWESLHRSTELESAVLDGSGILHNEENVSEVFTQSIEIINEEGLAFYVDPSSGEISYQFSGEGRNGEIVGVITLNSDFQTIARITILSHEETPGLGGVVAERTYLDKFVGKSMVPDLEITNTGTGLDHEVDAIAGATTTSDAFELMLNTSYSQYSDVWTAFNKKANIKSAVLDGFGIVYDASNIHVKFDEHVEIIIKNDLTIYLDKISGKVSYRFEGTGRNGPINGVITLNADFETIARITVLEQIETPNLGSVVAERSYLDKFVGKKMTPTLSILKTGATADNEVDALAGATMTSKGFELALNSSYTQHKAMWETLNK